MLEKLPASFGRALRRARSGLSELVVSDTGGFAEVEQRIDVTSPAFAEGTALPPEYTADGEGFSPPLVWRDVPPAAATLVLIVEDADSPMPEPLVHAIAWDLSPHSGGLSEAALPGEAASGDDDGERLAMGLNSFFRAQYLAPDPPPGHGPHRYAFQLFALDARLNFDAPPSRRALVEAMRGHVIAAGTLTGTYERP
jgi:Raf kinase inhibitor-like YbhB/YbcL family protein